METDREVTCRDIRYERGVQGYCKAIKYSLYITCALIFCLSAVIISLGLWTWYIGLFLITQLAGQSAFIGLLGPFIIFAVITAPFSLIGCYGSGHENRLLLLIYLVLSLAMLPFFLVCAFVVVHDEDRLVSAANDTVRDTMRLYRLGGITRISWDHVQVHLECCGHDTWKDWGKVNLRNQMLVPVSCCLNHFTNCTEEPTDENVYKVGCFNRILDTIKIYILGFGTISIFLVFFIVRMPHGPNHC